MYICVYMGWKAPCKSIKASMLQYNCTWQCTMHCNNCNNCKLRSTSTLFLGGFQIIDNDLTLCVLNMNLLFAGYHLKLNSEARQKLYIIEIELNSERKKKHCLANLDDLNWANWNKFSQYFLHCSMWEAVSSWTMEEFDMRVYTYWTGK